MRSFIPNWLLLLLWRRSMVRCRVRAVDALLWLRFSADVISGARISYSVC